MAWVYILRGSCGRYYIGSTENLDRRLAEHRRGKVHSTRRFGQPLELVTTKEMADIGSARELEGKLKAKKNPGIALYLLSEKESDGSRISGKTWVSAESAGPVDINWAAANAGYYYKRQMRSSRS